MARRPTDTSALVPVTFYMDPRHASRLFAGTPGAITKVARTARPGRQTQNKASVDVDSFANLIRNTVLEKNIVANDTGGQKLAARLGNSLEKIGVYNMKALLSLDPDTLDATGFGTKQAKLLRQLQKVVATSEKRSNARKRTNKQVGDSTPAAS